MSELKKMTNSRKQVHRQLLATVSSAALLAFIATSDASAAEADRPAIWIDFSGQFDQLADQQSKWTPDFFSGPHAGPLAGIFQGLQRPPRTGFDAEGKISFQPDASDWVLSASVRLGRARQSGHDAKLTHILPSFFQVTYPTQYNATVHNNESHMFVDFDAGKDLGIGMFGISSTISAGVRIANMRSRKDVHVSSNFAYTFYGSATNRPDSRISHEFRGVGPSIAWDASAPLAGNPNAGQLGIEWGVNAALLFGRQTTKQTTDGLYRQRYYDWANRVYVSHMQNVHSEHMRRQNATVPNVGGYIAASYRLPNAKVSLGYRADWYFNALDGGVAASQKADRGFFGPYASISIGLGD